MQRETMRIYRALTEEREDWGGGLVLCCGEGCADSGAPVTVSIAGGATLAIDGNANAHKAAMRAGYLDFVVTTLDEALRALRNEVRQKRPLSVGLIADVGATLGEMVERGVQPDLFLIGSDPPAQQMVEAGRAPAGMRLMQMAVDAGDGSWSRDEVYLRASDAADLKVLDERVLALLPAGDRVRRQWVERVPRYVREARSGGRWVWLSEKERQRLGV
jgi:urocanate hydratase